jgi:uncharacterized protein (TIGR00730 family)
MDPVYPQIAGELGEVLAGKNLTLVYGGGRLGLMGTIANSVLNLGGKVIGVIPENLKNQELAHPGLTELHIVKDMHERKAKMAALSDAFIALPGGFGTMEEMLEMITWNQLGIQRKPIGFLNVLGYYDPLINFFRTSSAEGFINEGMIEAMILEAEPAALIDRITANPWPDLGHWPKK